MSVAESTEQNEHFLSVFRRRFRAWRGQRPFWAGLLTLLGGIPIIYFPYASLKLGHMTLSLQTNAGSGALIIGVLLFTLGFTLWFQPLVRTFAGIAAILLALVSIPLANLGGFFFGFLFALIGGALGVAWAPGKPADESPATDGEVPDPAEPPHAYASDSDQGPEPWGPHGEKTTHATTIDANGGRNSAG
ncbi:DUF6114 domain-containing protein [Streptomyces sp. NPDC059828]|uniref:DUF6114 domain-containing protein n=1 Tax=Streptomyces sp. NPDC059828 TaxID=3346965 RepID=UPI00364D3D4C